MSYGIFMGKKVYCPKCYKMHENPMISYVENGKYYCYCNCGSYFEIEINE